MSKRYNIRWRESDIAEVRRIVKNYNAKLARVEKKTAPNERAALPEKMSVKKLLTRIVELPHDVDDKAAFIAKATENQLRELPTTRQDLQRELRSLERFSRKGAEEIVSVPNNEYNLKATAYQVREMTIRAATANRGRARRMKEILETELIDSTGEPLGYTKGESVGMGTVESRSYEPIEPFTAFTSRADLDRRNRMLIKESQSWFWESKDDLLRDNFIKSIENNFPNNEATRELLDEMRRMDIDLFREKFYATGGNFEENYPGDDDEINANLEALRAKWIPDEE